jgi:hypothetical protein
MGGILVTTMIAPLSKFERRKVMVGMALSGMFCISAVLNVPKVG